MSSNGSNVRTVTFDSDGSGSSRVRVVSPDNVTEKGSWEPYVGPREGFGWRNPDTDEVVYQDDPPGEMDLSALTSEQVDALEEALGTDLTESSDLPDSAMSSDKEDIVEGEYAYIGEEEGFLDMVERVGDDVRVRLDDGSEFWVGDKEVHIDTEADRIREEQEEREKVQRVQRSVGIEDVDGQFVSTEQIENNLVRMTESAKQDVVADNLLDNLESIDRDLYGGAYYRHSESKVNLPTDSTDSTLNHEIGHAIAGANGFDYPVKHAVTFAKIFVKDRDAMTAESEFGGDDDFINPSEYVGSTWGELVDDVWGQAGVEVDNFVPDDARDDEITLNDFKLEQVEGVDTSEEMDTLIDEINEAWEEQFTDWGSKSIGNQYSATNAHETMSRLHEHLQSPGINFGVMNDLIEDFPDLLDAYLDVFEPNEPQKNHLELEGFI